VHKENECSTASLGLSAGTIVATAAGALVAGGMGAIVTGADAKQYYFDAENNTYSEIVPTLTVSGEPESKRSFDVRGSFESPEVIESFSKVLRTLSRSGIKNIPASYGETPGVQGSDVDKSEQICTDYALESAKIINSRHSDDGIRAKVVRVLGTYTSGPNKGEPINHAIIKVEDTTKQIGYYTDATGTKTSYLFVSVYRPPYWSNIGTSVSW